VFVSQKGDSDKDATTATCLAGFGGRMGLAWCSARGGEVGGGEEAHEGSESEEDEGIGMEEEEEEGDSVGVFLSVVAFVSS
jgi:hypothetical protein